MTRAINQSSPWTTSTVCVQRFASLGTITLYCKAVEVRAYGWPSSLRDRDNRVSSTIWWPAWEEIYECPQTEAKARLAQFIATKEVAGWPAKPADKRYEQKWSPYEETETGNPVDSW